MGYTAAAMDFDDTIAPARPSRPVVHDVPSLPAMFLARAKQTPDARAWQRKQGGRWVASTWRDFHQSSAAVATWLVGQGIAPGEKITIVGSTRAQWAIADIGGQLAALVTVGAYPTLTGEQLAYIIDHSDSRIAFVEGRAELEKLLPVRSECGRLERIVVWDADDARDLVEAHDDVVTMDDVVGTEPDHDEIGRRIAAIDPATCAIIVYTSGTTGPPKGAMISHDNVLTVLRPSMGVDFDVDDHALSFLPMAHVAERILGFYSRINHGTSTAYASSIPAVLDELKEVRPTLFGSVPRIFEKAFDKIHSEVERAPRAKQLVFRWAAGVGRRAVERWQGGRRIGRRLRLQYALADRIVFAKLRDAFGGRVKYFMTGAAPIPREVLEFFWGAGFRIFEAYGMTEATVLTHANRPGETRLGSVGRRLEFIEQRVADDGEILLRGPSVFLGYYKNEEATREAVDADGWLHTGDIGRIDDEGYLYIVDRKKHIIITAGGKNLTPANIENEIKTQDPLISQVHAHGDRRPYVSALITVSPLEALDWALAHPVGVTAPQAEALKQAIMSDPLSRPEGLDEVLAKVTADREVRRRVVQAVRRGNEKLARVEQIKRAVLLDRELSVEGDELTPTMKVKRKNVETKFAPLFDRLYAEQAFGLEIEPR